MTLRGKYGLGKKIISSMVGVALVFTSIQWNYVSKTQAAEDTQDGIQVYRFVDDVSDTNGYVNKIWVDEDGNKVDSLPGDAADNNLSKASSETFPEKYNLNDRDILPPIRNQGQWGTCWAHSVIAAAETSMIMQGYADKSVNYSERHLAYFGHHKDPVLGDGEEKYDSTYGWYGGGAVETALATLAAWHGPALESSYPYSAYSNMADLDNSTINDSEAHLRNAYSFNPDDRNAIKSAIMHNGAVTCAYYSDDASLDKNNYAVYHASGTATDHAVAIVGWDDNYSVSNFAGCASGKPASNGAWLIRNSWGTNYGNKGYYWISYYDTTLNSIYSVQMDKSDDYDNIYQYDGKGYGCYWTSPSLLKSANVFTARSLEELKAVSFYTFSSTSYDIQIYYGSSMTTPESGTLVCSMSGKMDEKGYHTVDLDTSVLLDKGSEYSIVLTEYSENNWKAFIEDPDTSSANAGESFEYFGGRWKNMQYNSKNVNACIKGFTNNLDKIDKSALKNKIDEAADLAEGEYTASSWKSLKTALDNANDVYKNDNATILDIAHAIDNLNKAQNNLRISVVKISTSKELEKISRNVQQGIDYSEVTILLQNDIDMAGELYEEIGNNNAQFNGTFNGCGYKIKNLYYYGYTKYAGLFGYIGPKGVVKNINLTNIYMNMSETYSGGVAGYNEGSINNCHVDGEIICGKTLSGGITGCNKGIITNSDVNATITFVNGEKETYAGGIAAVNDGTIERCFTKGILEADNNASIGGIVANNMDNAKVLKCYNQADIRGNVSGDSSTGGIVCDNSGTVSEGYNSGIISRTNTSANNGAVCATTSSVENITNCYYLKDTCDRGISTSDSTEYCRSLEEFTSGKVSYELNTNGSKTTNTKYWSSDNTMPIYSDDSHLPIVKVTVKQAADNNIVGSINGISSGDIYVRSGDTVDIQLPAGTKDKYIRSVSASDMTMVPGSKSYIVPDDDTTTIITIDSVAQKHCSIELSDNVGIKIKSEDGFSNTELLEGNSYAFGISANEGYDITNMTVKYGDELISSDNGIYTIDAVSADKNKITVDGILWVQPGYLINGELNYSGYVGEKATIVPANKGDLIKQSLSDEYTDNLVVSTDKDISVQMIDVSGNESNPFIITFKQDLYDPVISEVLTGYVDTIRKYKGVNITVNATDSISGVAEYSFDNGETWQKENVYHVNGSFEEEIFNGKICVKDGAGNITKYDEDIMIPAIEKLDSNIELNVDNQNPVYGNKIILTANVNFMDDSQGGKIIFYDKDNNVLQESNAVSIDKCTVSSTCEIDTSELDSAGEYIYKAVYKGEGTNNKDSEGASCKCNIKKAAIVNVEDSELINERTVSADKMYSMEDINQLVDLQKSIVCITDSGIKSVMTIEWKTEDIYNPKGGTYRFTGHILSNEKISAPDDYEVNTSVIVTPVYITKPEWDAAEVKLNIGVTANASMLGKDVLPVSGSVDICGHIVNYSIEWNKDMVINLGTYNASENFKGTIEYLNAEDWMTIPDNVQVNRKVVVKENVVVDEWDGIESEGFITAAKISKSSVQINWKRIDDVDGYVIYRRTGSGKYTKLATIKAGKKLSYINKNLKKDKVYYYRIKAFIYDWNKTQYSEYSVAKKVSMKSDLSSDELKLNNTKLSLKVKKSKTIKVIYPSGRSKSQIRSIKYSSTNKRIVKVNSKGTIIGVKKGTAVINVTVKLRNGQTKKMKTKVTVIK